VSSKFELTKGLAFAWLMLAPFSFMDYSGPRASKHLVPELFYRLARLSASFLHCPIRPLSHHKRRSHSEKEIPPLSQSIRRPHDIRAP
jgi:hypothetical protein